MKKIILLVLIIGLSASPAWSEGQFVRQVIDGQTLQLLNGEHLHLLGINIPLEKAQEARDFVSSLVSGSVIALEYDVEKTSQDGKMQAYVWFRYEPDFDSGQNVFPSELDVHYVVDEEGDGDFFVLLNTTIVKAGLAMPLEVLPNSKYSKLINKLYEERPIETVKAETEIHAKATVD
jgi:hypothetical protein